VTTNATRDSRITVTVASGDPLDVRSFSVHERISTLFSVSVTAVSRVPDLDFEAIIGCPARFDLQVGLAGGARTRAWSGLCKAVREVAVEETGLSTSTSWGSSRRPGSRSSPSPSPPWRRS
jgi:type VI secretion system secreted protein VgrG